jgi:hypothetical protein
MRGGMAQPIFIFSLKKTLKSCHFQGFVLLDDADKSIMTL